jgi:hypothetical protein
MNSKLKNILIAVFLPSALALTYFGYKYLTRINKEKKIIEILKKKLQEDDKYNEENKQIIINKWLKALKELSEKELDYFYKLFLIKTNNINKFVDNKDLLKINEDVINSIKNKQIEKLYKQII